MPFSLVAHLNVRAGVGALSQLGDELKKLGLRRAFVVSDPGVEKAGIAERARQVLLGAGLEVDSFSEVEPNPRDVTVERAAQEAARFGADAVVGIGGGSALDAAKGVALLLTNPVRLRECDGVGKVKNAPAFITAVPTTAGTGSEATTNAAITDAEKSYKMSIRSPYLIPCLVVLDPELLTSVPAHVAASSGFDAITHAVEGFLSVRSNPVTDELALICARWLFGSLLPYWSNRGNLAAAERMQWGSCLAGVVISNTGTGNVHALARALGGLYDLPHGLACSLLFPAVFEFNAPSRPEKVCRLARELGLDDGADVKRATSAVLREVDYMFGVMGMPRRLRDVGVPRDGLSEVARVALGNVGPNPRTTSLEDLIRLLEQVW